MSNLCCCVCGKYLFNNPVQCDCGDRLCGLCFESYKEINKKIFSCPLCKEEIHLDECFRDKAVEYELRTSTLKCLNPSCPWEGESAYFHEHTENCKYALVPCSNAAFGCKDQIRRSNLREHVKNRCKYTPATCRHCGKQVVNEEFHMKNECELFPQYCPNRCGEKLPRKEVEHHAQTVCTHQIRDCEYQNMGCQFRGNIRELTKHAEESMTYHNQLHKTSNQEFQRNTDVQLVAMEKKTAALRTEMAQLRTEMTLKMQPILEALVKAESSILRLQEGLGEVSLLIQTLQAASYNGTFIWKIPEVERRRHEAKIGKTVSLYSAPLYTSRHGYKVCLRLYLNGDGSGKGTHLSFFVTIMRGEYDALLTWPFKQAVTLILVDQDKQRDIIQSFRPEPTSSSFQRPRNEMNVASGCPLFTPLSTLNNSSYVKEDTMFLKCQVNTSGLTND